MPITTADWIRYVESMGPADAQSVRMRLQAAGLDPERAAWIASMVRRREWAGRIGTVAAFAAAAGVAWAAYYFWLAIQGDPAAPGIAAMWRPTILILVAAFTLLISTAVDMARPIDLLAHNGVPAALPPPPRRANATAVRGAAMRMAVAMVALGLGFFTMIIPQIRNHVWLQQRGVETVGEISRLYTAKGSKGRIRYLVEYRFHGEVASRTVDRARYQSLRLGEPMAVTYLPGRPEVNIPQPKSAIDRQSAFGDRRLVLPVVVPLVMLPMVAIIVALTRGRFRRLAESGVATVGEVTSAHRQTVLYTYNTPEGMQMGRFHHGKRRLRERPDDGQPLAILYDPQKPTRSIPLGALSDTEFGS